MPRNTSNKAPSQRQLRQGEELRHALAEILMRREIRDDDLRGVVITVSQVRISPDARAATAYVMPLGGQNQERVVAALNRNARYLRGEVGHAVRMKYTPTLVFRLDTSFDESDRIGAALRSPEVRRDVASEDAGNDGTGDAEDTGAPADGQQS